MKKLNFWACHKDLTDEFEQFLLQKGKEIVIIHYGYANEIDLVVWRA